MIGGTGIGLAYLVPIATLVKWFPDRRGFIAGVAVAGFGAGALVTAPIATRLIQSIGVLHTFVWLGCTSLALVAGSAIFMVTPPTGWHPEGWKPAVSQGLPLPMALLCRALWQPGSGMRCGVLLFFNVSAGISIISEAAPMAQEVTGVNAKVSAATMVGIISIANGAGRFVWAWLSDLVGRRQVFLAMFLL